MRTAYLISIITVFIPSIIYLMKKGKIKSIIKICPIAIIIGIIWEKIALYFNWWQYNNILNIYFFGIPIEEYLFYIAIPTFIIAIYTLLEDYDIKKKQP